MAEKKKTTKNQKQTQRRRRTAKGISTKTLTQLFQKRKSRDAMDFKPDVQTATWSKTLRLTKLQQLRLTKWVLYALSVILSVVFQDVIMSKFSFFGATTDLPACTILLITVIEGTEVGSLFALIASTLYYFSGNAPFAAVIALMTILGTAATLFRQMYWHRSKGSIILCAALALTLYELGLFAVCVSSQLTHWGRMPSFALTALYSCLVQIPLYSLICKIGLIGGNTWKE